MFELINSSSIYRTARGTTRKNLLSLAVWVDFKENDHSSGSMSTRCGKRSSTGLLNWIPTGPSSAIGDKRVSPKQEQEARTSFMIFSNQKLRNLNDSLRRKNEFKANLYSYPKVACCCPGTLWSRSPVWCTEHRVEWQHRRRSVHIPKCHLSRRTSRSPLIWCFGFDFLQTVKNVGNSDRR